MNDYLEFFAPDCTLHPEISSRQDNGNTKQYLDAITKYGKFHNSYSFINNCP